MLARSMSVCLLVLSYVLNDVYVLVYVLLGGTGVPRLRLLFEPIIMRLMLDNEFSVVVLDALMILIWRLVLARTDVVVREALVNGRQGLEQCLVLDRICIEVAILRLFGRLIFVVVVGRLCI